MVTKNARYSAIRGCVGEDLEEEWWGTISLIYAFLLTI